MDILLLYGNCHAACISELLVTIPEVTSAFEVRLQRVMMDGTIHPPCIPDEDWGRVAVVLEQYDRTKPMQYGPAPKNLRRTVFPSIDSLMLWPLQASDKRSVSKPPEIPWEPYPYGDRAVMEMPRTGRRSFTYDEYLDTSRKLIGDLGYYVNLDKERHARRDQHSDVKMSDMLFPESYPEPLFWTFNHPKEYILAELARRIFAVTELPGNVDGNAMRQAINARLMTWDNFFRNCTTPIHPLVIEYFKFPIPDDWQYMQHGKPLTHEEWIMKYLHHDFGT